MFKNLKIENFRGITDLEVNDFRQFNLFVGKNNAGKSTILEAIFLLINPSNPELPIKINDMRNISAFKPENWDLFFHNLKKEIDIKLSCELTNSEIRYLKIKPLMDSSFDSIVPNENSIVKIETNNLISHEGIELIYAYQSKNHRVNEQVSSFRLNQTPKGPEIKINTKHTVPSYLKKLNGIYIHSGFVSEAIGKRFGKIVENNNEDRIIKVSKKVDPLIQNLKLGPDNTLLCDVGLKRSLPLNVMGGGLIKILSVIVAISEVENGILIIDEIENGLHISLQEILWKTIFETAKEYNVQIFATTHSSECLDALMITAYDICNENVEDIRLYRIEKDLDRFKIINYDHDMLYTSLEKGWEVR